MGDVCLLLFTVCLLVDESRNKNEDELHNNNGKMQTHAQVECLLAFDLVLLLLLFWQISVFQQLQMQSVVVVVVWWWYMAHWRRVNLQFSISLLLNVAE